MRRISQRLDIRLLLVVGVGLAVFSALAGWLTYRFAYRQQFELADAQLQQIVATVRIQAEIAAFVGNDEIGKGVLEGLLANPVIRAARIEAHDGTPIDLDGSGGVDFAKGQAYSLFSPLQGSEPVGRLVVVRNDEHVERVARQAAFRQAATLLLQVLAAISIMAIVLRVWLINPIVRLARSMAVIRPGSDDRLVMEKNHAGDEIGLLTQGANAILEAAAVAIKDLSEAKRSLELALAELAEKEQVKSKFFAAASHDLRQPIHAIHLFMEALKHTARDPAQQKLIASVETASHTLNELLESLLDISRLDAGVVVPQTETIRVAELFARIDNNFSPLALAQGLRFKLCFPQRPLLLHTDRRLLNMVLDNLVGNAFKNTNTGGVLVGVRMRGATGVIQVWDTGIGMESVYLERIYDEFYQIDNPSRDRRKGLGLGLAIVRRVGALLGCEVACRSRPGQGTMFELRLPPGVLHFAAQEAAPPAPAAVLDPAFFHGQRLVVLEDDELVAQGLREWLASCGCAVTVHASAERALADPAVQAADYFVVDYQLAGTLNGCDFLEALQLRAQQPLKAVILSGNTSGEFIAAAARFRWPLMFKPADPRQILMKLAGVRSK